MSDMLLIQDPGITDPTVGSCRGQFPPGSAVLDNSQAVTWDGKSGGSPVSAGVYIFSVESEDMTITGTIVVVR